MGKNGFLNILVQNITMLILHKLEEAMRRAPNPRKQIAIDKLNKLFRGEDVNVGSELLNTRSGDNIGQLTYAFNREFGSDKLFVAIINPDGGLTYHVAETAHQFIDTENVPVYVASKVLTNGMAPGRGATYVFFNDKLEPVVRFVLIDAQMVIRDFKALAQMLGSAGLVLPTNALVLQFHDEIIDQLIVSELVKREIDASDRDYLFIKCLFSPSPMHTMLPVFMSLKKEDIIALKTRMGLETIFDIAAGPAELVDNRNALMEYMKRREQQVKEVAEERVTQFLARSGIARLDDLMTMERAMNIRREIFGR